MTSPREPAVSGQACPSTERDVMAVVEGLRHFVFALQQLRRRSSALMGVNETDALALANVHAAGSLSAVELVGRLGISPSSGTALVDRLENAGLVTRRAAPADRRRLLIETTPHGEAVLDRARAPFLEALGGIASDRLLPMSDALEELARVLVQHNDGSNI